MYKLLCPRLFSSDTVFRESLLFATCLKHLSNCYRKFPSQHCIASVLACRSLLLFSCFSTDFFVHSLQETMMYVYHRHCFLERNAKHLTTMIRRSFNSLRTACSMKKKKNHQVVLGFFYWLCVENTFLEKV